MKWIGQHIYDLISRFRSDVYLEDISTGTIASGGNLGLDSDNKIVKATTASGDITSVVAGTGLSGTSLTGPIPTLNVDASQTQITSVGTITTGTWRGTAITHAYIGADAIETDNIADAQITVAKIRGSAIQTSGETFADNDTSLMTSAAIDDRINTKYAYQYIMFHASDIIKSNWITFGTNGLTNHTWGTDTSDSGVTVGSSTMACDKNMQAAGFKIPFACKLVGFYGTGHRYGSNSSFSAGVFILDSPDYNAEVDGGTVDTLNATLRAYAAAEDGGVSNPFNQKLNKLVDTSRSFDCPAGSMIFPAFKDTAGVDSGSFRGNMTVILATPIITIA